MVIQPNMSPKAIIEVWSNVSEILQKYNVPISGKPLESIVELPDLDSLLKELNNIVGSSSVTCIEGG
jgi:uncharacterized protein YqgV (UPF0045/DUF77 family)